jgi:preprotein translocase subunit SecE
MPVLDKGKSATRTTALTGGGGEPNRITGLWSKSVDFLHDVRGEMRKVVTPSRKEVQATTTVVIVTVFVFAAYFYLVDRVIGSGVQFVLHRLGAQ